MNYDDLLKVALTGGLTFGVASIATAGSASNGARNGTMSMVKRYGINAAHEDDCKSPGHSCAGQGGQARDGNAFVAAQEGLCKKSD